MAKRSAGRTTPLRKRAPSKRELARREQIDSESEWSGMSSMSKALLDELVAIGKILKGKLASDTMRALDPHLREIAERIEELDKELLLAHQLTENMRAAGWDIPRVTRKLSPKQIKRLGEIHEETKIIQQHNEVLVERAHKLSRERNTIMGIDVKREGLN